MADLIDKAEALLPCPFCGHRAEKQEYGTRTEVWAVWCVECKAQMESISTEAEAIAAWNRRALPARGVGVKPETVKDAVMGWVWAEDSDVSKRLGPKHTDALAPTDAAHVNETPKSEHDAGNVLTAPGAREAAQAEIAKLKAERDAFAEVCRGLAADVLSLSERLGGKDG